MRDEWCVVSRSGMHTAPPFRERQGFAKMKAIECVCCGWRDLRDAFTHAECLEELLAIR